MLHAPYEPISGMAPFAYALSGAHICIPGENPAEFESLLAGIKAEMKPTGMATQFLVEEMAQCQWKLRRSTVILRDHYRFLLNITDYKTVGNAFLRDNIGVHSITKLAPLRQPPPPRLARVLHAPAKPPAPGHEPTGRRR